MLSFRFISICILCLLSLQILAATKKNAVPSLAAIRQLHETKDYSGAEALLEEAVAQHPENQKVLLYYGFNMLCQKRYPEAESKLKKVIQLASSSWDAQQAMFLLAKVQGRRGNRAEALTTIARMKAELPDSGWLPQAWVVEAELKGGNVSEASEKLARQNQGEKEYKQIVSIKSKDKGKAQISSLTQLAEVYKGLPIELTARESIAHLLTLTSSTREAIATFQSIVYDLRDSAPNSRIVVTATSRMAALYHRLGDRQSALSYYEQALEISKNDALSENAVLKSAGLAFEILQHDTMKGVNLKREQWEEVRQLIKAARHNDHTTRTQIISMLMELESYQWSGDYDKAVECGQIMIDTYGGMLPEFRRELATAHVVLSRVAKERLNYSQSIQHSENVLELYPSEDFIWPKMDHLPRAYFDLIESLYSTGEASLADRKLQEFADRFPTSSYIRNIERNRKSGLFLRRNDASLEAKK